MRLSWWLVVLAVVVIHRPAVSGPNTDPRSRKVTKPTPDASRVLRRPAKIVEPNVISTVSRVAGTFGFTSPVKCQQMLDSLLLELPPGVQIDSVTCAGHAQSSALFQNLTWDDGTTTLAMPDGIFLCSGIIPPTDNTRYQGIAWSWNTSQPGDAELTKLLGQATFDAASITIIFTVDERVVGLGIRFMFGSDEFPEYVGGSFNDGFGVFLDGSNIAFDENQQPITINNAFFGLNNTPQPVPNATIVDFPIEYDGLTNVLTTQAELTPGQHTLKLAIADGFDDAVDSGVFVSELSFGFVCPGTGVPPSLAELPDNVDVHVGTSLDLTLTATDPNAKENVSLFTIPENLPLNMSLTEAVGNPATGVLAFAPTADQFGLSFVISVFAINEAGICDQATVRFHVVATIDLTIDEEGIEVVPASPISGSIATISGRVFNPSLVDAACDLSFYVGGLPNAGGALIDTASLSVLAGQTDEASVQWDTRGITGSQTLCAVIENILPNSGDDPSNNEHCVIIEVEPAPDLQVGDITIPGEAMVGMPISSNWVVTNTSETAAVGSWIDTLYLSDDASIGEDESATSSPFSGTLSGGESVSRSTALTLPAQPGLYWLVVCTDATNTIYEDIHEDNNCAIGNSPITVSPAPDLVVTSIVGPASASERDIVDVTWGVTNQNGGIVESSWKDRVFLSHDAVIGSDTLLAVSTHDGALGSGDSYTTQQEISLPNGQFGARYIVVCTDVLEDVYEFNNDNNNCAVSEQAIDIRPPDLVTESAAAPKAAVFGESVSIEWLTRNVGNGNANSPWNDRVYLSSDVLVSSDDTILVTEPGPPLLAIDGDYSRHLNVVLPLSGDLGAGSYFIVIMSDALNEQHESDESNNVSDAISIQLVYPSLPDLVVSMIEAPSLGVIGEQVELRWQVINDGDTVALGPWDDEILISPNNQIGSDQVLLRFSFPGPLAPGESYERVEPVALPDAQGTYWFVVRTDALDSVEEGSGEPNNSAIDEQPISVQNVPKPDLVVSSITPPSDGVIAGQVTQVSWIVSNIGNAPTAVPQWKDELFFSVDPALSFGGPGGDQQLCNEPFGRVHVPNPSYLEPGDSYTQVAELTLPSDVQGPFFLYIVTDRSGCHGISGNVAETNNINNLTRSDSFSVVLNPQPNLIVHDISFPLVASSGFNFTVDWSDQNVGEASTGLAHWSDAVYLSTNNDPTVAGDRLLGTRQRSGNPLLPGQIDATPSLTRQLPPDLEGLYFVKVLTDSGNAISEFGFESDNISQSDKQVNVILSPSPDLTPTEVDLTTNGIPGHPISITYDAENFGADPTSPQSWIDRIYLSPDSLLDTGTDVLLKTVSRNSSFIDDQFQIPPYSVTVDATLPPSLSPGAYFAIVDLDASDGVFEHSAEGNNILASTPFNVVLQPTDLQVAGGPPGFPLPTTAASGEPISLTWQVTNTGTGATPVASWVDQIYLSTDSILSQEDQLLATFSRVGALASGASYTATASAMVPSVSIGSYSLLLVTDRQNQVYEQEPGETNNVASSLFHVNAGNCAFLADLFGSQLSIPSLTKAGALIQVEWTVTNSCFAQTRAAMWTDALYLSLDDTISINDLPLGTVPHSSALPAGESYTGSGNFTLPIGISGQYRILVAIDAQNQLFEFKEDNNIIRGVINIEGEAPPAANLLVTSVNAPLAVDAGTEVIIAWTVENAGESVTPVSNWRDSVFLSSDNLLGNDILLGTHQHNAVLQNLTDRMVQQSFLIPPSSSGDFFVIVAADSGNVVNENGRDGDNFGVTSIATRVASAPPANLIVTDLTGPTAAISGQNASPSWTIINTGEGSTVFPDWRDGVYLSRDLILNTATDLFLGDFVHTTILNSQQLEPITQEFRIPLGASGPFHFCIAADRANRVFEGTAENDNTLCSSPLLEVNLPPISDLSVTAVATPGPAVLGETVSFSWQITNTGAATIQGSWSDSVFLSLDQLWDISDTFVGTFPHFPVTLSPGISTPGIGQVAIPAVNPGLYYVITRSDVFNQIPESNNANNVGQSASSMQLVATPLTLGVPLTGPFPTGTQWYFQLQTPANQTVRVSLDHSSPEAWTELYVRKNTVPTIGQFDFSFESPGEPDQALTIPTTEDTDNFILARATSGTFEPDGIRATILAQIVPFGVSAVSPESVGDAPRVTIQLTGSRFLAGSVASLRSPLGQLMVALKSDVIDGETIRATFNLEGAVQGAYDVIVTGPDNQEASLPMGLIVTSALPVITSIEVSGPQNIRAASAGSFQVRVRNLSNQDIPHAYLVFSLFNNGDHQIHFTDGPKTIDIDGHSVNVSLVNGTIVSEDRRYFPIILTGLRAGATVDFDFILNVGRNTPGGDLGIAVAIEPVSSQELLDRLTELFETIRQSTLAGDFSGLDAEVQPFFDNLLILAADSDGWHEAFIHAYVQIGILDPLYDPVSTFAVASARSVTEGVAIGLGVVAGVVGGVAGVAFFVPGGQPVAGAAGAIAGIIAGVAAVAGGVALLLPPDPCSCCTGSRPSSTGELLFVSLMQGSGGSCGQGRTGCQVPVDPNEKIGPDGFGAQQFVASDNPIPYQIFFENVPEATANAAIVTITDKIDSALNIGRFRLGNMHFGDITVAVPPNRISYQTTLDLSSTAGILLQINAGINAQTREAFWVFRSVDPETGDVPADPFTGFLPPNDASGRGEGWVQYTIEANPTAPSGSVIHNSAVIVFDTQPAIETNEVINTLDADAPASSVASLPAMSLNQEIPIGWVGQDTPGGSEIAGFSVFASVDGGAYLPITQATLNQAAIFLGEPGHTYAFYSIATDNAGNVEAPPTTPDATTAIPSSLQVVSISVNGGLNQRANVSKVDITFDLATNLEDLITNETISQAITIWRRAQEGATPVELGASHYTWIDATHTLTIDLTFDGLDGDNTTLLIDGNYELRMNVADIHSSLGVPLEDSDGLSDGVYRFGYDAAHRFFRLAGDANGDRVVNFLDQQLVRSSWLLSAGQSGFDRNADVTDDGTVNFLDQQMVRNNWLTELPF